MVPKRIQPPPLWLKIGSFQNKHHRSGASTLIYSALSTNRWAHSAPPTQQLPRWHLLPTSKPKLSSPDAAPPSAEWDGTTPSNCSRANAHRPFCAMWLNPGSSVVVRHDLCSYNLMLPFISNFGRAVCSCTVQLLADRTKTGTKCARRYPSIAIASCNCDG